MILEASYNGLNLSGSDLGRPPLLTKLGSNVETNRCNPMRSSNSNQHRRKPASKSLAYQWSRFDQES
ncbi:MAG: hypothetical protein DWH73_03815 [Planctomycetota bacterium]|nr:MAG: hypothetical protein DWH73_03815 [Planctomycetota bacterium]